jgi:pimeloyl-ACP methyl ester carboxylesterase
MLQTLLREEQMGVKESTAPGTSGVHVTESGSGEPAIVFLPGLDVEEAESVVGQLAEARRVLAFEHPGFAEAPPLPGIEAVRDVAALYLSRLDELDAPVHLVGASLGGWIAAEMAATDTRHIRSLTLAAPLGLFLHEAPPPDIFMLDAEGFDRIRYHDEDAVPDGGFERTWRIRNMATLAMFGWNPRLHDPGLARRLARAAVPTLVLWGEDDRVLDPRYAHAFASALPSARVEFVPGAGHALLEECVERVAPLIAGFHNTVDTEGR